MWKIIVGIAAIVALSLMLFLSNARNDHRLTARDYLLPTHAYSAVQKQENLIFFDKDSGLDHVDALNNPYPELYDLYQRYGMYSTTNAKYFLDDRVYFNVNVYMMHDRNATQRFVHTQLSSAKRVEHNTTAYNINILPSLLTDEMLLFYNEHVVVILRVVDRGKDRQAAFMEFAEIYQGWLVEQPLSNRYE